MRLLKYREYEEFTVTEFKEKTTFPYALLFQRWRNGTEEATFEVLANNASKNKSGHWKTRSCAESRHGRMACNTSGSILVESIRQTRLSAI